MNDGYPDEGYEPEIDDLTREELGEFDPMWRVVADTLDDWLMRMHGITSSHHHAGCFLELLAAEGYRVTSIDPGPPLDQLLGAPAE